ncbi:hypothetical protein KR018_006932 [Drosophila ironensis]|nr:hypothetical protein KR018_006932 [Drosophila ironensis]
MKIWLGLIFLNVLVQENSAEMSEEEQFLRWEKMFNTEYYTSSVVGLVKLLRLEENFMQNLTLYTDVLQEKVNTINVYLDSLKRPIYGTLKEREKFVSNPINAFGMIRRLHQDWPKLQNYSINTEGLKHLNAMEGILKIAPESFDMDEALKSMQRIETTYELQAKDLVNGIMRGKKIRSELGFRDLLSLARHKIKRGDYQRAFEWFANAKNHMANNEIINKVLGNPLEDFASYIIVHNISLTNQSFSNETIKKLTTEQLNKLNLKSEDLEHFTHSTLRAWNKEKPNIQNLTAHDLGCQGLFPKPTNLVCRYNTTTTPFLKLAPLKMEEISRDPYIVVYHNVISDKEIEEMKGLVYHFFNGWTDIDESKEIVSRLLWLRTESSFRVKINQRIEDMTGFKVKEFPAIQLANFGVGGYFKPHHDYFTERIFRLNATELGDRIGSLIIYAGNVSQGGQTLFPDIQVEVEPQKGNSLFWFNTFDDATPDPRSLHSVCPVLVGDRWTITKWLHYDPQQFVKPCHPRR